MRLLSSAAASVFEVIFIINLLCFIIMFLLVAVDQLIKVVMQLWLFPDGISKFIPGLVQFHYAENRGAAFGILENARWVFIVLTVVVCTAAIVLMLAGKIKSGVVYTSLVFIVSGGIGNLIDRIFRGYVIDFVEPTFMNFAIFNFADCLITVGGAILIFYLLYDIFQDYKTHRELKGNA